MLKPYDKEHMKMAMLKHEEVFKQQVYELHRLYQIQKKLMKGIIHDQNNRPPNTHNLVFNYNSNEIILNRTNSNRHNFHQKPQPVEEYVAELNKDADIEIEDESEIQLTLGPTRYNNRKKKRTETSDSGASFSSSSTGSSSHHQNREKLAGSNWGRLTMVTSESNYGYRSVMNNNFHVQGQSNQGRISDQQPPWLLQALSLNMS